MTWLYSILFTGLMLASGTNETVSGVKMPSEFAAPNAQNNAAAKKMSETERFEQTYPFDANGTVSVSNINGSIKVEAWDNAQVKLEVVKTADTKESLQQVEVKIDARQDVFRVETDYENNRGGWKNGRNLEVGFHLFVPRTAILNEIETVNGSVAVSNFTNYTKVTAVNGEVKAANLRGSADLSTVNGTVEADFQSLEAVRKISLETVNGKVLLTVPSDSSATLKADSLNGEIVNDFGLPVRKGEYVGKDLYGKIGAGETQIKMSSVNGDLSVKRRGDGKNPSPAINLLPPKGRNDDEDSNDEKDEAANAKMNADITKSVADSRKEAAKAIKEAQKELRKLKPEIGEIDGDTFKETAEYFNSEEFKNQIKAAADINVKAALDSANFNWSSSMSAVEKKSESFTVKGSPKVTVDAKGCNVTVRGWDKPEVAYTLKRFSKTPNSAAAATADHTDSSVQIRVVGASENDGEADNIRLEIFVPKKSDLKITTDGEIRLEGVSGNLDLQGDDESINIRDAGGKLHVVSADALVRVVGFKGELDSTIQDGKLFLEGDFEKIFATTEDGEIVLTLPENADASLESNLENVRADGITLVSTSKDEAVSSWKIGKGGAKFRLNSDSDGKITVRGKNAL